MDETRSITDILEEVKNDMCDNYCKYPETVDLEDLIGSEICDNCPFNRL